MKGQRLWCLTVPLGGLTFGSVGVIFAGIIVLSSAFLYAYPKDISKYYVVSLMFMTMVVIFYVVMHERYLYPVLMLCLMSLIYTRDRRFMYVFIGFSITNFYNVAYVLDILIRDTFMDKYDKVMLTGAAFNVALTLYLIYIVVDIYLIQPWKKKRNIEEQTA